MEAIPYNLIAELMRKMSVKDWIELYEKKFRRKSNLVLYKLGINHTVSHKNRCIF